MGPTSKFTDPNLAERVRAADRKLTDLVPEMDKAKRCGIDISTIEQTHQMMRQAVDSLRREYFG